LTNSTVPVASAGVIVAVNVTACVASDDDADDVRAREVVVSVAGQVIETSLDQLS
jgi:hypothetical protein